MEENIRDLSLMEKSWDEEGVSSGLAGEILFWLYQIRNARICGLIRLLALRFEKGIYYSKTIRRIFSEYEGVHLGMYSGSRVNFSPRIFQPGTKIGRYTTITDSVRAFSGNHPTNTKSSHAFFFNHELGVVKETIIKRERLSVGNDVFIGHNAILLSGVNSVGDGAYIGAGAVVTKNVPPYAIVAGNPARIIRYRYPENVIKDMLESKWWEKSIEELRSELGSFNIPLDGTGIVK